MLIPYPFDPRKQVVAKSDPEFMRFLRREFPDHGPTLFLYFHLETGNWCVAGWTHGKERGRMVDLVVLGPEPVITREKVGVLRGILCPAPGEEFDKEEFSRGLKEVARAEARERTDSMDELLDAKRAVYKRRVRRGGGAFWDDVRHRTMLPQRG